MKTPSFIRKSLYSALVFFGTLLVLSAGYATWNSVMMTVSSGSTLSSSNWNALVDNISDLDSRWSRNGAAIVFTGGNVGIGTVSPDKKLTMRATSTTEDVFLKMYGWYTGYQNRYFQIFRGNNMTELISSGDTGYNSFAIKMRNADPSDNQIGLNTALFVDGNSNIGVGTVNPKAKLSVGFGNEDQINMYSPGDNQLSIQTSLDGQAISTYGGAAATLSLQPVVGLVGIGTTSATRKFFVNGDSGGTTGWYNDSDERLKKNITTITGALDKIENLRGVNFEWKDTTNHPAWNHIGFIAQEAREIVPESVDKKGEFYSMDYSSLTSVLVEAVKELKKENDTLKQENKDIKDIVCLDHPTSNICK